MAATVKVATDAGEYQPGLVGGAYWVKGLLRRLGVAEAIDQALTHQPESEARYGQLAEVPLTNRLTVTPDPRAHLAGWAAEHGIDRVFGLRADWLDADRLGARLDGLADHPVDIGTAVLRQAVRRFGMPLDALHADPTSVYFAGAYPDADDQPLGGGAERVSLLVAGYPPDGQRRPVPLVRSMVPSGRTPVGDRPWDGNPTAEAVYVADRSALRQTRWLPQTAVLLGDRRVGSQSNLLECCRNRQRFLAAHPWTDTAAGLAAGQRRRKRVADVSQNQARQTHPLRWVLVHSSAKAWAAGEQALRRLAGWEGETRGTQRATIEARLERDLQQGKAQAYCSDSLTGSDGHKDWQLRWRRLPKAIEADAVFDGVALWCSNVPATDWSAETLMIKYKEPVGVEQAIDFIKRPVQIRPMWLHQPKRLAGLTRLIMLAVLIAALRELQGRRWIAKAGQACVRGDAAR